MFFAVPAAEADARLSRYFTLLIDLNLALQLPAIAFAIVYHRELVQVFFAGKYLQYSNLFPLVLALSIVPSSMSVPISLVAQYHERAGLMLASELFGLYQVGAMLVLVPALGLYGAALSTGSFHALRNFWIWWQLRRQVQWRNIKGVLAMGLLVWGSVVGCLQSPAHASASVAGDRADGHRRRDLWRRRTCISEELRDLTIGS